MKSKLPQFVDNIVNHTECSKRDKEDMFEELLIHLEISRDEFMKEGLSLEEAEEKAMEVFGAEGEIGSQLQQAIFPYRKEFMLTLAISSLLFTICTYLVSLFVMGDAYIGWLCASMLISGTLLFLPLNKHIHLNKKLWLNSLLILQILNLLYGLLISSQLSNDYHVGLSIWAWLNTALALILVYRTTVHDYHEPQMKVLHGINIASGIVIIGGALFFLVGSLILTGGIWPVMLIYFIPIVIWLILYVAQMGVVKKLPKLAFFMSTIPFLIIVFFFLLLLTP